jgi:hypothetical protein
MTVTNIALVGAGFGVVALLLLLVIINAVECGRLSFGPLGSLTIAEHPFIYQAVVAFLTILIGVFLPLAVLLVVKGTEIYGKADPRGQTRYSLSG